MNPQPFVTLPPVTQKEVDLAGKTAIITGSNISLGFECAIQLLDLNLSRLILAVRNESKNHNAKKRMLAGGNLKHTTEVWPLNLANYKSIMSFAERSKGLYHLDIFVNNEAVSKAAFESNKNTGHVPSVS